MTDHGSQVGAPHPWKQLVNDKALSDVTFAVGQQGTLIYGHRSLLAAPSDVFFQMFTGELAPTGKDPIKVPDIEPAIFLEMIKFIYHDDPAINAANLVKLYYAAEKYNLSRLIERCLNFVKSNEDFVMKIFHANSEYGFERLYEVCLEIIRTKPFKIFQSSEFLELPFELVKKIAGQSTLWCNADQLIEALEKWSKHQEEDAKIDKALEKLTAIVEKQREREFEFRKIFFSGTAFSTFQTNMFVKFNVKALVPLKLYGVGIYVQKFVNTSQADPNINKISVFIDNAQVCNAKALTRKDVYIYDCMFEEVSVQAESFKMLEIRAVGNNINYLHIYFNMIYDSMVVDISAIDKSHYLPAIAYILYRT